MTAPYEGAITSTFGFLSELVEDDDLKNKLDFEKKKLQFELDRVLLSTKTNPWVDGGIKVLIALRDIIIPMLRPAGAFYLSYKGVDIAQAELAVSGDISALSMGLASAFPAWGASRHVNKNNEQRTERTKLRSAHVTEEDFD